MEAVLAFAAIHLSCTRALTQRAIAERFHSSCVTRLIDLNGDLPPDEKANALAAVCLLRSYEILAEQSDPNRHLYGAYALASQQSIDFSGPSLIRACFFNYLREDITYALMSQRPLKIELGIFHGQHDANADEDFLNQISLLLGRVINEAFASTPNMEQLLSLKEELALWGTTLPSHISPYCDTTSNHESNVFPKIYTVADSHTSTLQYQLIAQGVIRSTEAITREVLEVLDRDSVRLCGLSFTSGDPAVLVNSFGPLAFLCAYLRSEVLRDELVVKLKACRKTVGWPVERMIDTWRSRWSQQDPE